MTVLGKILVIVNFIFTLVTGALIVMLFIARTNWKEAHDKLKSSYDISVNNSRTYVEKIEAVRAEEKAKLDAKDRQIVALNQKVEQEAQATQAARTEKDSFIKRSAEAEATLAKATEELSRRKQEVDNLTTVAAEKDKKLVSLENTTEEFRNKMVAAEINYRAEHERNMRLLEVQARLEKDNQRLQAARVGTAAPSGNGLAKKTPPDDVRGAILEVDQKSSLVTISIGSDSGVAVGHTLEVYRLEPKPEYLGTIRVVDVHFKEAVARPVSPLQAGRIQKGDVVASHVVALRQKD